MAQDKYTRSVFVLGQLRIATGYTKLLYRPGWPTLDDKRPVVLLHDAESLSAPCLPRF